MDFRHNAARRRRVMRDERLEVEQPAPTETAPLPFKRYQTGTVLSSQPALLDLLPKSRWLNAVYVVGALAIAIGFLLFPLNLERDGSFWVTLLSRVEWWSIEQPGSLGQMFLLVISLFNAGLCYQIYHLRRHRSDDYHGAYQVWKWALIPALGLAVVGTTVPAAMLGHLVIAIIPVAMAEIGTGVVLGVAGVVLSALLVRLYFEVRESRMATIFLGMTAISLIVCLTLTWNRLADFWTLPMNSLLSPTSWWLLTVTMGYGMLLNYFGYVYRDVIGEVPDSTSAVVRQGPASVESEPDALPSKKLASKSRESIQGQARVSGKIAARVDAEDADDVDNADSDSQADFPESDNILTRRKRRRVA
ncbi:MAG: hypothetical protein Q8M16_21155 [Pirellulaceae bacterium]|nr:hypothetical protein [Pirellulaceae bacterium]